MLSELKITAPIKSIARKVIKGIKRRPGKVPASLEQQRINESKYPRLSSYTIADAPLYDDSKPDLSFDSECSFRYNPRTGMIDVFQNGMKINEYDPNETRVTISI